MKKILLLLLLAAVWTPAAHAFQKKTLKVVTTMNYLKYIVERIGTNRVNVIALANPKQDPHYVTPTPRMNDVAHDADLFIENGLTLDTWAKHVVQASGNPAIQAGTPGHLVATNNVPIKELPLEVSRAWGDIHPQGNPHVWLDPLNVKIIAENIAERLKQIDPAHTALYEENLTAFKYRIDAAMFGEELLKAIGTKAGDILTRKARNNDLSGWLAAHNLEAKLGGWMRKARPLNGLKIISYHKTYVYFAERFGLHIVSELEEKPGIPPPPKHRDAVVDLINREGITVILNDNFYSRDAADYVASKTSAKVVVTYIEVGATEDIDTYEGLITYLIDKIVQLTS